MNLNPKIETQEPGKFSEENFFSLFPSFDGENSDFIIEQVKKVREELRAKAVRRKVIEEERYADLLSPWNNYGNGYTQFLRTIINLLGFNKFIDFIKKLEEEKGTLFVIDLFAPDAFISECDSVEGVCLTLKDFKNYTGLDYRKLDNKLDSYVLGGDVHRLQTLIRIKELSNRQPNLIVCSAGGPFQAPIDFKNIEFYFYQYFKLVHKYLNFLEEDGMLISQIPFGICKRHEPGEDPERRKNKFADLFKVYSQMFELDKYFECNVSEDGISFRKRLNVLGDS
ncbi:MAG: hypothetical protein ACMG57_04240 [Candidatus Dojkabacteria bacterium]